MKWADYCISKLTLNENNRIASVIYCEDLGDTLSAITTEQNRQRMVSKILEGKTFCAIKKVEGGRWSNIGNFSYDGNIFQWFKIPKNLNKRKTFKSYYHYEDQEYKEKFNNLFDDLIIHKSVEDGDIDSDNSDEYIKQLIHQGYLHDTTVLIVLIGPNTKHRMHVDWEISGSLNYKVGDKYSGLLGLKLPSHPNYGTGHHHYDLLSARLSDNLKSGYAIVRDWTEDKIVMQEYIELAFERRTTHIDNLDNSRKQMTENTNE